MLVIGEDFLDYAPGLSCCRGVGHYVFGECDQAFPQRPTTTSLPGRLIQLHGLAKHLPALPSKQSPRYRQIA